MQEEKVGMDFGGEIEDESSLDMIPDMLGKAGSLLGILLAICLTVRIVAQAIGHMQ